MVVSLGSGLRRQANSFVKTLPKEPLPELQQVNVGWSSNWAIWDRLSGLVSAVFYKEVATKGVGLEVVCFTFSLTLHLWFPVLSSLGCGLNLLKLNQS